MTAMRSIEYIVKTTKDGQFGSQHLMLEHSENLVCCIVFRHPIEMIQACKCRPTHINGAGHVTVCPIKYLLQLLPVGHLLVADEFQRCSRHDEPVVLLLLHLLKVAVECHHVLDGCILACVRLDFHEL